MSDATPAYRGYRLQTLYTLSRILEVDKTNLVFHPEGAEDFSVWENDTRLIEVVQVKAYSASLTLSLLSPNKADSFLYRVNKLVSEDSNIQINLASFGSVGPELQAAISEDGSERRSVVKKLSSYEFLSVKESQDLLCRIGLVSVSESHLKDLVFNKIKSLAIGIDPQPAFEMLSFWLYICAEKKQKITKDDLVQRLNDIGRFLSEREAHHVEWFRSIVPIEDSEIEHQVKEKLLDEFYRGISARYDHILADVDKPRPKKITEIRQGFEIGQNVIVHGASGQGKTTLAYRYLHDHFSSQWRFQIRVVENRQQALNIAAALSGQAKSIGVPIAVYIDVSPNDLGWEELVKQLSVNRNIQVLVTVREEDFRRASISGAEIQFIGIELSFERAEAEAIYSSLTAKEAPDRFLDFEDAWSKFGSRGPLMEFVYLITQGTSLRERLQQQVKRIQNEVRASTRTSEELEMLRLVSIASAFEARLNLRELIKHLQLLSPQRTLELLEKEYLIRRSKNGTLVAGLHPVRSGILVDILTDPVLFSWVESASVCLPLMFEYDLENFLLYTFSRHRIDLDLFLPALYLYQPTQWSAIAGIVRALIWLGVKEYVEANLSLMEQFQEEASQTWTVFLDVDVADAMPGVSEQSLAVITPLLSDERREWALSIISQQTDKADVFDRVSQWLTQLTNKPEDPKSESDWQSMADSLFWIGRLGITLPISEWISHTTLDLASRTLPLKTLADLSLGLFQSSPETHRIWMSANREALLGRFREESCSVLYEDDGTTLRTHYLIKILHSDDSSQDDVFEKIKGARKMLNASMTKLSLLRGFFPDYECYGSRGYGHMFLAQDNSVDDTKKDIAIRNLPLRPLVKVNSIFLALGEQYSRPSTWEIYARTVVEIRRSVLRTLQYLTEQINVHFRKNKPNKGLTEYVRSEKWKQIRLTLETSPMLPRCAFDEWGFASESHERRTEESQSSPLDLNQNLALEKYYFYVKAFNEYIRTCSNFFKQAEWLLLFNPELKGKNAYRVEEVAQASNIDLASQARLSTMNLADAWKSLPNLQSEFEQTLSQFFDDKELHELDRMESNSFSSFWKVWYFFAFHPTKSIKQATKECSRLFNAKVREIRKRVKGELQSISSESSEKVKAEILSDSVHWENESALWIKIDGKEAVEVFQAIELVVEAVRNAIHSVYDNPLRFYAVKLAYANIIVVPMVRGNPLNKDIWKFHSDPLSLDANYQIKWWNSVPSEASEDCLAQLSLSPWQYPRLSTLAELRACMSELYLISAHIKDFDRLPELDDRGQELMQAYVNEITPTLNKAFQRVIDKTVEAMNYFTNLSSEQVDTRLSLCQSVQALKEMHEQLLPDAHEGGDELIDVAMSLEELYSWADKLHMAQQLAFAAYLFWASDVLEEHNC